jgi:hypothetical protein
MRIAISQSMLFPWVGLLEQVRLADVFVHYDDVQFSKGSFVNRVQVKTSQGVRWMTLPLKDLHLGQSIDEVQVAPALQWRGRHLDLLRSSFEGAPYISEALELAEEVYGADYPNLGALARASLRVLTRYFGLDGATRFVDVEELNIPGESSDRVLSTVRRLNGDSYITGHGAARYLNHEGFEHAGVHVEYMKYRCLPYPQSYGEFTPYVSSLDLIANCGRAGANYICSDTVPWREFLHEST